MAPKITLTYFPIKGRAESTRQALFLGGVDFQDKRLKFDEFKEIKSSLAYGQLPILEVDGQIIYESIAQLRLAGKLSGLYPTDALEAAKVDSIMDSIGSLNDAIGRTIHMDDPEEKAKARAVLFTEEGSCYKVLTGLTKMLATSGGRFGYSVGTSLTVADLAISRLVDTIEKGILDGISFNAMGDFPAVVAVHNAVESHPGIKEYNNKFNTPKLKVTYFQGAGRAESIRLALAYGGLEFEDERLDGPGFMERKPSLPMGQLPTLEIDGKVHCQSRALTRYAGLLSNTYPTNPKHLLYVEEVISAFEDVNNAFTPSFYMSGDEQIACRKELIAPEGKLNLLVNKLDKRLEVLNKGKVGFSCGFNNSVSIADFLIYGFVMSTKESVYAGVPADYFDDKKFIVGVYDAVHKLEKVQAYYASKK